MTIADQGFIRLRRGLFEHIQMGKMKADMLSIYIYLHFKVDIYTGMVYSISAPYIRMNGIKKPIKHIQRQLTKLEKEGYIKRFGHRGQIHSYGILLDKYLTLNGVLIDAANSKNINEIAWTPKLKGNIIGTYSELKCRLGVVYVSPLKELKNIRIEELNKNLKESIDEIYNAYPNKCPIRGASSGKCNKNKEKIKILIKEKKYKPEYLVDLIDKYIQDCKDNSSYIKNFSTFLNQLPDPEQFEEVEKGNYDIHGKEIPAV